MSEVTTDLVWYPPEFPAQGRLPSKAALVANKQQKSLINIYLNGKNDLILPGDGKIKSFYL